MTNESSYDPISFDRRPSGPTYASYSFPHGNSYVGAASVGDQAALRSLVHILAERIEELEGDAPKVISTTKLDEKPALQRAIEAALAAEEATEEGSWKEARSYLRLAEAWVNLAHITEPL